MAEHLTRNEKVVGSIPTISSMKNLETAMVSRFFLFPGRTAPVRFGYYLATGTAIWYWFFGHYHENMVLEKRFVMLYEQIIRLK